TGNGFETTVATVSNVRLLLNDGDWTPPPPLLSVDDVMVTEGNTGAQSATFTVSLSRVGDEPVTVAFATADRTATAGSDYQATSGILSFAPGETMKTITVLVNGEGILELDESFVVNLSSLSNATIYCGQGVATIVDNEPRVSISNVTRAE